MATIGSSVPSARLSSTCSWQSQDATQISRHDAMEYYAQKSRLEAHDECSCPPCGEIRRGMDSSPMAHNGYWSFFSNPGHYCEPIVANSSRCDGHTDFASLAATLLRGKRVLFYGNSLTAHQHFAAMCDMRRSNASFRPVLSQGRGGTEWPSSRTVYYKYPWKRGVYFPSFDLNLTYISNYEWPTLGFCEAREEAIKAASGSKANATLFLWRYVECHG